MSPSLPNSILRNTTRATVFRVGAILLSLFTVAATTVGWVGLSVVEAGTVAAPDLATASEPTAEVLDAAASALGELRTAMGEVASVTDNAGQASEDLTEVLGAVSELAAEDLPATLAAVESSLPALIDTAAVIDGAMSTLSIVGVRYDPDVPFDEALLDVQTSMDGLAEQIAEQGAAIRATVPVIDESAGQISGLGDRIRTMDGHLERAETALAGYDETLDGVGTLVEVATTVRRLVPVGRVALVVLGLSGLGLAWLLWSAPMAVFDGLSGDATAPSS